MKLTHLFVADPEDPSECRVCGPTSEADHPTEVTPPVKGKRKRSPADEAREEGW